MMLDERGKTGYFFFWGGGEGGEEDDVTSSHCFCIPALSSLV